VQGERTFHVKDICAVKGLLTYQISIVDNPFTVSAPSHDPGSAAANRKPERVLTPFVGIKKGKS